MTESEKTAAIANLEQRAQAAERAGLKSTAKSWRDYIVSIKARSASEIIFSRTWGWD